MSTQLFALGDRARWTTAVAFLALATGLGTTSTAARAAGGHPAPVGIIGAGTHGSRAPDVTPLARQRLDAPVAVGAALVALAPCRSRCCSARNADDEAEPSRFGSRRPHRNASAPISRGRR
jgi:hypothetical protein